MICRCPGRCTSPSCARRGRMPGSADRRRRGQGPARMSRCSRPPTSASARPHRRSSSWTSTGTARTWSATGCGSPERSSRSVLAPTRELSVDAAELVAVDYDPLPVVTEPAAALEDEDAAVRGGRHERLRRAIPAEQRRGAVRRLRGDRGWSASPVSESRLARSSRGRRRPGSRRTVV